jgi:hypothetical protein
MIDELNKEKGTFKIISLMTGYTFVLSTSKGVTSCDYGELFSSGMENVDFGYIVINVILLNIS